MPAKRKPSRARKAPATPSRESDAADGGPAALDTYRQKRDFTKTSEPQGGEASGTGTLRFVIQKHAATNLHFDLRLELEGVMKSWAVPKGPSLDPAVKRLAMQVEDHPIEYNTFEGTIPEGEYGGGTVMLWDQGTYGPDRANAKQADSGGSDESVLRAAYDRGDFKFVLHGERLRGSWVLVRTRYGSSSKKPQTPGKEQWLLIKHRDAFAAPLSDIVATDVTSVTTGRTMDEITADGPGAPPTEARAKQVSARATRPPPKRLTTVRSTAGTLAPKSTATRRAVGPSRRAGIAAQESVDDDLPQLPFTLTHPDKVMFPADGYTKGDLAKYYARVASQILPVIRDRPLALKRYPDGIDSPHFFQQKAPAGDSRPTGVRVERVPVVAEGGALNERIVGGTLATLLYTVQLGCIEVNPWHARVQSLETPDYAVIDLDPAPKLPFERIVEVATWVHDALATLALEGTPKTSGSRGIHIYIPLPQRAAAATALGVARRIAELVVERHPRATTIERELDQRPARSVYVDFLQNARGKTLVAPYSVRPVEGARVSTPLTWAELTPDLDARAFTIATVAARIERLGDLWTEGMSRRNAATAIRDAVRPV